MNNSNSKLYLGLGKVLFNSSLCSLSSDGPEIFLTERITRVKADGTWPEAAIEYSNIKEHSHGARIADNRDVKTPTERENELNKTIPFLDYLKKKGLDHFSSVLNSDIQFVSHHLAHANVAKFMSPFNESAILVLDGAGSEGPVVSEKTGEEKEHEEASLYHLKDGDLKLIKKEWQKFTPAKNIEGKWYSHGIGTCYEMIAEYIFNSKRAAGKVMGLAAFGKALDFSDPMELLESLDWNKSFKGKSKAEWEASENLSHYESIAATIQKIFEDDLLKRAKDIKNQLPQVKNLILIGGCALNCVSNQKLLETEIFESIYAPPNPGDEGIGLGCALYEFYRENDWSQFPFENQHGYFGPKSSIPSGESVESVFSSYKVSKEENTVEVAAKLIEAGEVIAWFQGRSESGPRALGNRSILARVDKLGLKSYLNKEIKFREAFRPYGCSVLEEKAHEYFESKKDFPNPYMSFAVRIKADFSKTFKEVCHVDGTSRIQTVSPGQNKRYYDLIKRVGELTKTYAVLNTSLNIMGEPILESVEDARNFLDNSKINYLVIGDYLIERAKD